MKKALILLFTILQIFCASAQTIINGKIFDNETQYPLKANITVLTINQNEILAADLSNDGGIFKLQISDKFDSILVKVNKIGYTTIEKLILNKNQRIDFPLSKKSIELKELEVKSPPIKRSGDTLTFKVEEFAAKSDRTIGDVIAKLPGITVESSGKILYQGKAINRYYIENLNLLDGRYGLVNENLSHFKVVGVEIYENHQPIRILDSLKISETAAINLKLKKKDTYTTPIQAGIGLNPFLWESQITPMVFTPNFQLLGTLQGNNIGLGLKNQITSHIEKVKNFSLSPWLQLVPMNTPPLSLQRWNFNNSKLGSLNLLSKNKNDLELKLNSNLLLQNNYHLGQNTLTYSRLENPVNYTEISRNLFDANQFTSTIEILKNNSKEYFSNILNFEKIWNNEFGNNQRSDFDISQKNTNENILVNNNFHKIFKRNSNTFQFYSLADYQESNQKLSVNILGEDSLFTPVQNVYINQYSTHNYFEYSKVLSKRFNYNLKFGNNFQLNKLQSNLSNYYSTADTLNHLKWNNHRTYLNVLSNIKRKNLLVSINTPLSFQNITLIQHTKLKQTKWVYEPSVNLKLTKSQDLNYNLSLSYSNQLAQFGDVFSGYIMTNYLNIFQKNTNLRDRDIYRAHLNVNYFDFVKALSFNFTLNSNIINQNLISVNEIQPNGSKQMHYIEKPNSIYQNSIGFNLKKALFQSNTNITISSLFTESSSDRFLNNMQYKLHQKAVQSYVNISNQALKYLSANYSISNLYSTNSNNKLLQFYHKLNLDVHPQQNILLRTNTEIFNIKNKSYHLSDVTLQYSLPKFKQDIELGLTNIFNQNLFKSVLISDYYVQESTFQLRPRQVMIRTRLSL